MAVLASKMFQIDIDRKTQNPFVIVMGQKRHNDSTIFDAQEFIERNHGRPLERNFRKCTGNSVTEYIQRVKVEHVNKELEVTTKTINEIIINTGYRHRCV